MEQAKVSMEEAVFLYTKCKIDMAKKFRDGMTRQDFEKFERTLDFIDKSLEAEAERVSVKIKEVK